MSRKNNLTFFDAAFVLLAAGQIITNLILGRIGPEYAAPVVFCGVLYLFARKDLKDRIIPVKWWLACVPVCLLGLITAPSAAALAVSVVMAGLFFILGFFRVLNGADALGLCCMYCCFCGLFPAGIIIMPLSFVLCSILMLIIPGWEKGAPYLVPLSLCCALGLAF